MVEQETHEDRLFEQAFDLLIRLRNDPTNLVTLDLIEQWRARSSDHESIWEEAVDIHSMANMVVRKKNGIAQSQPKLSRRSVLLGAVATAAVVPAGMLLASSIQLRLRADHITSKAELSTVPLPDGSAIILGPDSAIAANITNEERRIELLTGMAFFEVALNDRRPFEVVAGNMTVTALRASFDVAMTASKTSVTLESGAARVDLLQTGFSRSLSEGQFLSADNNSGKIEERHYVPDQIGAWRDQRLVAQNETIASVVDQIAPWKNGKVILADVALGAQSISGVYNLSNPLSALQAAVGPLGGRVREITPWLTIVSRV